MRPRFGALAASVVLFAMAPLVVLLWPEASWGRMSIFIVHMAVFGAIALHHAFRDTKGATFEEGTLALEGDLVSVGTRVIAKRGDLAQAFVIPMADATLVRLERRRALAPPIFLRVPDEDYAATLIRELGFDASRYAAEMRIASGLHAMSTARRSALQMGPALLILAILTAANVMRPDGFHPLLPFLVPAVLIFLLHALSAVPTSVRIGTDGIVTRWFGRSRFVDHARIASVETYGQTYGQGLVRADQRGVLLRLIDGSEVKLPTGQGDVGEADALRLSKRIEQAREVRSASRAIAGTAAMLARGERSAREWVRSLRGLGAGAVGPRRAAATPEVLLRVVDDPAVPILARASAAIAAMEADDADARLRIRACADRTASPELRTALVRIAEAQDDEAIAEAIETLDGVDAERGAERRTS